MKNKSVFFKSIILVLLFVLSFNFVQAVEDSLGNRLKGKLLLQVEDRGRIWYVNSEDSKKYEVTILNSLPLFREFALGISSEDLNKIPLIHESKARNFGLNLKGRFLLDVENQGRIWYVDFAGFRHEIKQENVLEIFKNLALGISNKDLEQIETAVIAEESTGDLENIESNESDLEKLINNQNFQSFWELWNVIKEKYVDSEIDTTELFNGAKKGLVEGLGDDYSTFMTKEESQTFLDDLSGHFEGIGAEVAIKNGNLTVIAPLPNMPAERSGVRAGDIITHIDGQTVIGMSLDEAVSLIRGEKGTLVVLSITHNNGIEEDVYVMRNTITYASLSHEVRDDGIGYVRMIRFNTDVDELFAQAIDELLDQGVKGIILDLRNNPGGYMNMAVDVASYWTGPQTIVSEKYKDGIDTKIHLGTRAKLLSDIPTVVLVNTGSASASEIVAGALQDYGLATLVGEKTFGKGSVQEMSYLSDGSYIKITVSKWYTPIGNSIDGEGISPDIEVEYTAQDYAQGVDPQLNKALEILKP